MEYNKQRTMNPTDDDLTIKSSIWLASRIMPGKGNKKISFTHFKVINDTGARTADFADFNFTGMAAINNNENIVMQEPTNLIYKGCWTVFDFAVIGHSIATKGLVTPFNTFNVGYRYKRGWRAQKDVN